MKNAQRNKKIYAICIALLFIISSSAALIPNLEVLAYDESYTNEYYLKDIPYLNEITSSKLFCQSDYEAGIDNASNISTYGEDVLKNAKDDYNGSTYFYDDINDDSYFQQVSLFFDDKDELCYENKFNDIYFYSRYDSTSNNYKIMNDFFTHPDNWTYYYIITLEPRGSGNNILWRPYIYFYISQNDFKAISLPGKGYTFSGTSTVYRMDNKLSGSQNSVGNNPENSVALDLEPVSSYNQDFPTNRVIYSNIPTYFTYENNGVSGEDYSQYSSYDSIKNAIQSGTTSPFLIDRRELLSAYTGGNYTVDTDPVSQDNLGSWLLLCQPQGELPDGTFNIKYVPTKYTSDLDNVSVSYDWRFELHTGSYWSNRVASFLPGGCKAGGQTGLKQVITGNTNIGYQYTNNDWQKYTFKSILGQIYDVNNNYIDDSNKKQTPSMYDMLSALVYSGSLNTKTFQGNISSGLSDLLGFNISLAEGTQTVTSCFVTINAEVSDNNGHTRNSSCTYDFLTGKVDIQNTASTDNDISNVPQGVDPQEYQTTINNMLYPSGGGNGSGSGGNSNANGGNSTSTGMGGNANATANNEINVKSNWQYFIESTEESTENANGLAAIQDGYEEVINFDYQNDSFLRFLFTSGIWSIHPFDYILAFLGTMVTIGIFTGILKLFRG